MTASMLAKNISKKTLAAPGSRSSLFICAPRSLAEAMERSEPERLQALQTHLINLPSVEGMAYPIGALVLEDIMAALAYVYRETGQISQQIFTAIFQLDLRDIQTVIETDSTFPEMLRNQLKGRWVMQVFRKQGISGWNSRSDRLSAYIQCIEQIAQPPGFKTRRISRITFTSSSTCSSTWLQNSTSNVPSSNGIS